MGDGSIRRLARIGLALLVLVQLGCGDGPTEPSHPVVGSWAGTIADERAGSGVVELHLENDFSTDLVGSWSATVAQNTFTGPLTGTVATTPILLRLSCGNSAGDGAMFLTLEDGMLSGQHLFHFGRCDPMSHGTVEFTKR
jgi:hypothetical protein